MASNHQRHERAQNIWTEDGKETVKDGECWIIRIKKESKDLLQGAGIVKFIKYHRLIWCGHGERMQTNARADCSSHSGTRKRGRPRKRRTDEAEERLNTVGIRNWQAVARDHLEWRKILLEGKVQNGL